MKTNRRTALLAASLCLSGALAGAGLSGRAAPPKMAHTPSASANGAMLSHGKAIATKYGCRNCHGATLAGKAGFAPSLHASGVLKEYNTASFVRVMDTGVMPEGGIVRKPMPVYHLKATDSRPLYAYLKTLK